MSQDAFGQANNADRDAEIIEAMDNLVTTTAADRSTINTLSATIEHLTDQLAMDNSQLVTALAVKATLTATNASLRHGQGGDGGRGRGGRGRGQGHGDINPARIGGPTGRFYCWLFGVSYYHSRHRCRGKMPDIRMTQPQRINWAALHARLHDIIAIVK